MPLRRLLSREQDSRDAVQDAFLSAFTGLATFNGRSQLGTWLHRIVINACLIRLRSPQRQPERFIDDLLPRFLENGDQGNAAVEWRASTERLLQQEETKQVVRAAIDQLPDSYRAVLLLRDIEGLDTEAAAGILEINIPLVKTRLHRARQALRGLLDVHFRGGTP